MKNNVGLLVELYLNEFRFGPSIIEKVISKYTEPWRKYHNINHINDLLIKFRYSNHWKNLTHLERKKLNLAIIFHDVVYEVGSKTNEIDSAEFLKECNCIWNDTKLNHQNFSNDFITEIYDIILSTSNHIPTSKLSEILIELDLSSFESPWKECKQTADQVQDEYLSKYSLEEFCIGQIKFLESYKPRFSSEQSLSNIKKLINHYSKQLIIFKIADVLGRQLNLR